jgi:hypothetical protein
VGRGVPPPSSRPSRSLSGCKCMGSLNPGNRPLASSLGSNPPALQAGGGVDATLSTIVVRVWIPTKPATLPTWARTRASRSGKVPGRVPPTCTGAARRGPHNAHLNNRSREAVWGRVEKRGACRAERCGPRGATHFVRRPHSARLNRSVARVRGPPISAWHAARR